MSMRRIHLLRDREDRPAAGVDPATLRHAFDAVRSELKVPGEFSAEVLSEAESVAASPELPERDETSVAFLTIDPPGSKDLDQAMFIERSGSGFRVRYAIADVPAFVRPGGAIDAEARRRGQTIYAPDQRTPLHPAQLSEDAASLLPDQVRPAYVWDMRLDERGEGTAVEVYRAMVRSQDRMDYAQVQEAIDDGTDDERLSLLKEVGRRRVALERERGGASLPLPEQEVRVDDQGRYVLGFRPPMPAEDWNAQISLMTGMAGAELMLRAGVGILRTMPEPDDELVRRFRRQAQALGVDWPEGQRYGEFLRSLDRDNPKQLALIHEATALFRGAGYTPFDGALPEQTGHAAVAAPYAHVTAPLRRLVDRFGLVVCEAVSRGAEVPGWVTEVLPTLPEAMSSSDRLAGAVERACTDVVEAASQQHRVGETFEAVVVDSQRKGGVLVQITDPAILATCDGEGEAGSRVTVRLTRADLTARTVRFELADGA